jgi:hypothetical protein
MKVTVRMVDGKVQVYVESMRISRMWVGGVDCSQTRLTYIGGGRINKKGDVVAWRGEDDCFSDASRAARRWMATGKPAEVTYSQLDLL